MTVVLCLRKCVYSYHVRQWYGGVCVRVRVCVCVCVCAYTHVWQLLIHMVTERARIREVKKVPMEFFNFVNMHAFFIPMYY